MYWTVPNLLSYSRFLFVLILLIVFFNGSVLAFIALYALAWSTDILDGMIARATHQTSVFGQHIDSLADTCLELLSVYVIYMNAPWIAHTLFWPLTALGICFGIMVLVSWQRLGKVQLLHTILFKISSVGIGTVTISSFFFDVQLMTMVVIGIIMLACIEAIALFLAYGNINADTRSFFSAYRDTHHNITSDESAR